MSSPLNLAKNTNSACWAAFLPPFPDYRVSVSSTEVTISPSVELFYLPKQAQSKNSGVSLHQLENTSNLSASNYEEDSMSQMTTKGEDIQNLLSQLTLDNGCTVSAFNVSDRQPLNNSKGIFNVHVRSDELVSADQPTLPPISQSDILSLSPINPTRNIEVKFYLPEKQEKKKVGRQEVAKTKYRRQPYNRKVQLRTVKNPYPEVKSTVPRDASIFDPPDPPPGRTTFLPPMNAPTSFIPFAPSLAPISAATVSLSAPAAVAAKKQETKMAERREGAKTKHRHEPYDSKARSQKSIRTSYPVVESTTTRSACISDPLVSDPFSLSSSRTAFLTSTCAPDLFIPSELVAAAAPSYPVVDSTTTRSASVFDPLASDSVSLSSSRTTFLPSTFAPNSFIPSEPVTAAAPFYPVVKPTTTQSASVSDPLVSAPVGLCSNRTTYFPSTVAPNSFLAPVPTTAAAPLSAPLAVAPSSALLTPASSSALVAAAPISTPVDAAPSESTPPILSGLAPAKGKSKVPALACMFCRGRKIACGPPGPGPDDEDKTCKQCKHRGLLCSFPEASQRGLKKKPTVSNTPDSQKTSVQPKKAAGKDTKTH